MSKLGRIVHSTDHYIVHVGATRNRDLIEGTQVYLLRNKDTNVDECEFCFEYWAVLMANESEGVLSTLDRGRTASEFIRELYEDPYREFTTNLVDKTKGSMKGDMH